MRVLATALAALLALGADAQEDEARVRLRRVYDRLPAIVRQRLGPAEGIRIVEQLPFPAAYSPLEHTVSVRRDQLGPSAGEAELKVQLAHEAHHKEFHRQFVRWTGLSDIEFLAWAVGKEGRLEYYASGDPQLRGMPSLYRMVSGRDGAGKPVFVEVKPDPQEVRRIVDLVEKGDRDGLRRIAQTHADPEIQELADRGLRLMPGRFSRWAKSEAKDFGHGFAVFSAGVVGAGAIDAAVSRRWDPLVEGAKEVPTWRFLRDYGAFSAAASTTSLGYRHIAKFLPKNRLLHHFAGRTIPLTMGIAAMDAVRGEVDPALLGMSLVTLEAASWATSVEMRLVGLAARRLPWSIALPVPVRVAAFALEGLGLSLTLYQAGFANQMIFKGLSLAQSVQEQEDLRERMTRAHQRFKAQPSVEGVEEIAGLFEQFREGLFVDQLMMDDEARARVLRAIRDVEAPPEAPLLDQILQVKDAEARAWILERVFEPLRERRRLSYEVQLAILRDGLAAASDQEVIERLGSEMTELERRRDEEEALGRPRDGVSQVLEGMQP